MNEELGRPKRSTESLEKYFFAFVLETPKYFHRIKPVYFKNNKIKYVYEVIREYYLDLDKPKVPGNKKILELIRLYDPDGETIPDNFLEMLLSVDAGDLIENSDDDYLKKALHSWITSKNMNNSFETIVDYIRDMDEIDYSNTEKVSEKVRELITNATLMNYDDDDLGLNFFDPESHIQDIARNKISSGWASIDELMNGGWDRKTLNLILGASNSGKSLWLGNIAVNAAENGKNVAYITLEMSDKKVMKRLGSNRLRIPIDEYDKRSRDVAYMEKKMKALKKRSSFTGNGGDMFNTTVGEIYVKEYASGTCTVADVDNYVKNLEEKKGIKIDMVVVDYLTIMQPEKSRDSNLFTNGKYLSNGLRAIAQTRDLVMVTAMQIGKDGYGANDIDLGDISESKAIVENTDTCFGIIRTDAMRRENKYILKLLKIRDGGFKWEKTHFELNTEFLRIENDKKLEAA
jgi:replicative DNA helicase